jgi:hypothetical protein
MQNDYDETDPRPDEQIRIEGEVRSFLTDPRHLDFEQCEANKERLLDFLDAHDLPITASGLHLAYETLKSDGVLELTQPQEPVVVVPAPPAPQPSIVVAPASSKQTVMYRNGQRIEGIARRW